MSAHTENATVGTDSSLDVVVCDVAPRDGLQNEDVVLDPSSRFELVARLRAAGVGRIEAVSFVRDDLVPTMAGAEAIVEAAAQDGEITDLAGLVLNARGYERLAATGLQRVHVGVAMSDQFGRRNAGRPFEVGCEEAVRIARDGAADGRQVAVSMIVAFGCPFEGPVDRGVVTDAAARMIDAGASEISLADTIGVATPTQVARLVRDVGALGCTVGVHLHDTRNTAVANAWAALEAGARVVDASTGGTGGCPFAPRAAGNLATEDLLYLLEREGVRTGIDLDRVIEVGEWLGGRLGRQLPSRVARAGRFVVPEPVA